MNIFIFILFLYTVFIILTFYFNLFLYLIIYLLLRQFNGNNKSSLKIFQYHLRETEVGWNNFYIFHHNYLKFNVRIKICCFLKSFILY